MRICIIGPASNVHIHRWSTAMLERGHSVSLLSTSPLPAAFPAPLTNVPVYEVPTARPGMGRRERFTRLIGGWARVPSLLASLNPDIVHVHSLPVPAATPFLMRVPRLVVSAWGSDVVWRHPRKERLYPWLLAHATRVTATSEYLANVVASYLRAPRTIEVIAFGVDGSIFYPAPMRSSGSRIGTLRHLEPKYGIDTLIRSLPAILAAHPSAFMDIAGEGEQRHHLEQMIDTLGVARRLHLRGTIEHVSVPAFLRSLDLYANPSREEAFGVAAVEAQASGLPVVASWVGALPEVVLDGETGLLVPPDDPAALAEALSALLAEPDRAARMGQRAREWVMQRYRWEDNVQQMLNLYEEVRASA